MEKRTFARMECQSPEHDRAVIQGIVELEPVQRATSAPREPAPATTEIDVSRLAASIGLDPEAVLELLRIFVVTSFDDLSRIKEGILTDNLRQVAEAAHSLKGAALSFELNDISTAAKHIELAVQRGGVDINEAVDLITVQLLAIDRWSASESQIQA